MSIQDLVKVFHNTFGHQIRTIPQVGPKSVDRLRIELINEEFTELKDALDAGDMIATADALGDIAYVVYGAAVSYGIELDPVIREIHRSNMSKLDNDGQPITREDGKILKSNNYTPPDISGVLQKQVSSNSVQSPSKDPDSIPITQMVIEDLRKREQKGIASYGDMLHTNNGRDAMLDLYEELLDACQYIKQVMMEREDKSQ